MNSPDFWRLGKGLCPDYRGYPATLSRLSIPIGGEYLEIPSIAVIHCQRCRHGQKGGKSRACDAGLLMAFDLFEKTQVGLLISFSVEVGKWAKAA